MGKTFKLTFSLVDGQQKTVEFEVPEGEKGKSAYEYAKEGGYTGTEEDFAKKMAQDIVNSTETDPTVPEWAKKANKPSYTKGEVGLGNVDNVRQYSASNKPPYPVTSVNGKTGAVKLSANDVDAQPVGDYALKKDIPTKTSQLQNDAGYLKQHQDISHLLPKTELSTAINTALAQAKTSGEFEGPPGPPYTLTDADKQAITDSVIASLPVYQGEVVEV